VDQGIYISIAKSLFNTVDLMAEMEEGVAT